MSEKNDVEPKSAREAVVLEGPGSGSICDRMVRLLEFLGVPWHRVGSEDDLLEEVADGSLSGRRYAVLAALSSLEELNAFFAQRKGGDSSPHSIFFYLTSETNETSVSLGSDVSSLIRLKKIEGTLAKIAVTGARPALCGPMDSIECVVKVQSSDWVLAENPGEITPIITSSAGIHFFTFEGDGLPIFVNCSSAVPDIAEPLSGARYDVKDDFLSTVPLLLYLKWAFRDVAWNPAEAGACFIVDDPVLKTHYGFCDFRKLDAQMQEHSFSTNIAAIPWNWRRTSPEMANLVKNSEGRLSVSIHGCDHIAGEFGTSATPALEAKVGLAKWRMEQHHQRTGVHHDSIMVFPQGVFSRESMRALQRHGFTAAVNTELTPSRLEDKPLTIEEAWSVAILRYGGLPLFTRRYPRDGVENFAFDLLLGKPCLVVEHHEFFKGDGEAVVKFVDRLNALKCKLHWRSLEEVIRRAFQWRERSDGKFEARIFANEAVLTNPSKKERDYEVEQQEGESPANRRLLVSGQEASWKSEGGSIRFRCKAPPGTELLIESRHWPTPEAGEVRYSMKSLAKIASRRLLSEFRDNVLSRHKWLLSWAGKAKTLTQSLGSCRESLATRE